MKTKHLFFNENTEYKPATQAPECTRPWEAPDPAETGAAEGEITRCAEGFGVSVDLSRFYTDERERCAVWVPHGAVRARWLAARLSARMGLGPPARLALLSPAPPAGLLHPDDPLLLLRPHCTLSVVPVDFNPFKDVYETDFNGEKLEDNQLNEMEVFDTDKGPQATANACERTDAESGATAAAAAGPALAPHDRGRADDALREMKQAALSLLDSLSVDGEEEGPARARRRRVRRRRRPVPVTGADLTDASEHKVPKTAAAATHRDSDVPEDDSGDVQGSGGGESEVERAPLSERELCPARACRAPSAPVQLILRRAPSLPSPEPRLVRALDTSAASVCPIYAISK